MSLGPYLLLLAGSPKDRVKFENEALEEVKKYTGKRNRERQFVKPDPDIRLRYDGNALHDKELQSSLLNEDYIVYDVTNADANNWLYLLFENHDHRYNLKNYKITIAWSIDTKNKKGLITGENFEELKKHIRAHAKLTDEGKFDIKDKRPQSVKGTPAISTLIFDENTKLLHGYQEEFMPKVGNSYDDHFEKQMEKVKGLLVDDSSQSGGARKNKKKSKKNKKIKKTKKAKKGKKTKKRKNTNKSMK